MADTATLEREMTWTSWADSCRQPAVTPEGDLRQCRRRRGHSERHASGFGTWLRQWDG